MKRVTPLKIAVVQSGRPQKEIAASLAARLGWADASAESKLSRIVSGLHADEATREAIAQELGRRIEDLFEDSRPEQEMQAAA